MKKSTGLTTELRQRQHLSLTQLQFVRLLEMNTQEIEDEVERKMEENPALGREDSAGTELPQEQVTEDGEQFNESAEELQRKDYAADDTPYYRMYTNNRSADDDRPEMPRAAGGESLYDVLLSQLGERSLSESVYRMACYIVWSLDRDGYLRRPLGLLVNDMRIETGEQIDPDDAEDALRAVRDLEPHGVGASDLRDCLLLQLKYLPESQERDDAKRILTDFYDAFEKKHVHRLVSGLKAPQTRVKQALNLILSLNPRPAASLGSDDDNAPVIIPDFVVTDYDGELVVTLNNSVPDLRIEESFGNAVKRMEMNARTRKARESARERSTREFVMEHYRGAKEFISNLKLRQETLFAVMTAIVEMQKEFFLSGDPEQLKPMGIRDVAMRTGYDISVISRATANKYVETPHGNFQLRYFFSGEIGSEGNVHSSRKVKKVLKQLVDEEDKKHPLSDRRIEEEMRRRGYDLSRRTVQKYRSLLDIPVARLRREE